jgi:DnaJ-class molecular chaperone
MPGRSPKPCASCKGQGSVDTSVCELCHGQGTVLVRRLMWNVHIAGVPAFDNLGIGILDLIAQPAKVEDGL